MAVRREDPGIEDPPISDLEEAVLGILEDNGVPEEYCDRIIAIINEYENEKYASMAEQLSPGGMRE